MPTPEIARQVAQSLRDELSMDMSAEEVTTHIEGHLLDRKVVMASVLQDLLSLARTTRDRCVATDEETGSTNIDTKIVASYLKTVDTIAGVYRSGVADKV